MIPRRLKPGQRIRRMKYGIAALIVIVVAAIVVNVPNAGYVVLGLVVVAGITWTVIRLKREQQT